MKRLFSFLIIVLVLGTGSVNANGNKPNKKANMEVIDKAIELLKANIFNPLYLETPEWKALEEKLHSKEIKKAESPQELRSLFVAAVREADLPFTHFNLLTKSMTSSAKDANAPAPVELKEVDSKTALLTIRTFGTSAIQLAAEAVGKILTKNYDNLIIDLRDNTGGSLETPIIVGQMLTAQPIDAGVYLTRKWYANNTEGPTAEEVAKMPFLKDMTYAGIQKVMAEEEAFRMVLPGHNRPTFKGKVYVLTNENTASAGEPLVDLIKKKSLATIVGTTTAGAMLSGNGFKINEEFSVFLPVCDYYTAEGNKIDKVGITPHIETSSAKALDYVLELIENEQ